MGISCDMEIGSMESEMSTSNKEPHAKTNGQLNPSSNCIDSDVKTAADISLIDSLKSIPIVSPIPPEIETIVIDDHEPEEGEITNSDNDAGETGEFEYEAISSDEEFTLRQKIEALEARNLELEKIASISSRSMGYSRSPIYGNYKSIAIDDAAFPSPPPPTFSRTNFTRPIPPLTSVTNLTYNKSTSLTQHVEDISSDEVQLLDSENEYVKYSRSHHRLTKKEKRRKKDKRHKHDERSKSDRNSTGKQQQQVKLHSYSSDSDTECLKNREELKMALNINAQMHKSTTSKSTLSHKLSALQRQFDDTVRKSSTKRRRCKSFDSPARDIEPSIKRKIKHSDDIVEKKRKKAEFQSIALVSPIRNERGDNGDLTDEDELISLEEQELRLLALKSAVLKKHEARKKRQLTTQQQSARPYSPTDSVIADESGERSNDCNDSDNNNMDISPISSPGNQSCQPMDMELASSNENSKSPVFCSTLTNTTEFEQFVNWGPTIAVPVPINAATFIGIDQSTGINQSFALPHSFPILYEPIKDQVSVENQTITAFEPLAEETIDNIVGIDVMAADSEEELRAQLIEQMRSQSSSNSNSGIETIEMTVVENENMFKSEEVSHDTLEEDCLRSLLLSSKGKKEKSKGPSNDRQSNLPNSEIKSECDDIPKLTMNLREALKRLKANKTSSGDERESPKTKIPKEKLQIGLATVKPAEMSKTEHSENCDAIETEETVVNNCLDKNKNEFIVKSKVIEVATVASEPALDVVPAKQKVIVEVIPKEYINQPKKAVSVASPVPVPAVHMKPLANLANNTIVPTAKKLVASQQDLKTKSEQSSTLTTVTKSKVETNSTEKSQTTKPSTEKVVATNLEALRKSTASPVITVWKAKPVKKLIISLNADSSSDNDENDRENQLPTKTDSNSTSSSNNDDPTKAFQLRLDQFLQSVRANTDAIHEPKKPSATPTATTVKTARKSVLIPTQKQQITPKVETSKAVRHLPISSQLEYHRLITRMKLLEKQKEQKSRSTDQQPQQPPSPSPSPSPKPVTAESSANEVPSPTLTITLKNERCPQTDKSPNSGPEKSKILHKLPTTMISTRNSLAKQVLVKNTIENLICEEAKLASGSTALAKDAKMVNIVKVTTKPASAIQVLSSVPSEQQTNNLMETSETGMETSSEPNPSISIAVLAKRTPKIQATVLANYEKRYRDHGEQYFNDLTKLHRLTCRTNLETLKQQKLELDLEELKKKVKLAEEAVTRQKTLTKNYYPAMAAAEKSAIMNRSKLLKLESCCNQLGTVVQGTEYKIKCDKAVDIKLKLKQISLEKNKLKTLNPLAMKIATVMNVQKAPPKPIESHSTVSTVTTKKPIEIVSNNVIESKESEKPKEIVESVQSSPVIKDCFKPSNEAPSHVVVEKLVEKTVEEGPGEEVASNDVAQVEKGVNDVEAISKNDENQKETIATISTEIIIEETKMLPEIPLTTKMEIDAQPTVDESVCSKYSSPLDHMQCDSEKEPSSTDRNSIVCPFDLMGRCEDENCQYQHLT